MTKVSRRAVIKAGASGMVGVAAGAVTAAAQAPRSTAAAPAIASASRLNGPLFFDAQTASGMVRTKTTQLLSPADVDEALQKAVKYRPPGQ